MYTTVQNAGVSKSFFCNEINTFIQPRMICIKMIIILKWFLKDHVMLKTRVMAAENSAWCHRNKL